VPSGTFTVSLPSRVGTHPAAERHGGEVHGISQNRFIPSRWKNSVLAHVHDDVEVSGRSAGGTGFAFADEPQLLAGGAPAGILTVIFRSR
jgi:hypothetical protein